MKVIKEICSFFIHRQNCRNDTTAPSGGECSFCSTIRQVSKKFICHTLQRQSTRCAFNICRNHVQHVYRSLAGTAPVYLADEYAPVTATGRGPLRSADNLRCLVKRSHNLWNSLPELNSFGNRISPSDSSNDR